MKRSSEDIAANSLLLKRRKRRIDQRNRRASLKETNQSMEVMVPAIKPKYETPKQITFVSNTMAELKNMTTDISKQNEAYGRLFRWSITTQITNNESKVGDETTLRRVLEMKRNESHRKSGIDAEWNIWLCVKLSKIPNSGHGLYSMRRFAKGEIMAYYFGTKVSSKATRKKPYQYGDIDAKGGMSHSKSRLLLGVHFANDPTIERMKPFSVYDGARYEVKKSLINARLAADGCLVAMKQICFGEEIYINYHWHSPST
jgi:hypothetical protein